jgi:hypothetical protein
MSRIHRTDVLRRKVSANIRGEERQERSMAPPRIFVALLDLS